MEEQSIGRVTHYFPKVGVAAIKLDHDVLLVGDKIRVKGKTTDFTQEINSIQIEHQVVAEAKAGEEIGIKIDNEAKEGDEVYKVIE